MPRTTGQPFDQDGETPETALVAPAGADRQIGEILGTPPAYFAGLPVITNFEELVEKSIVRMLSASSVEELLSDPESAGLRDYSGQVLLFTAVTGILPSGLRQGEYYAVVEAVDERTGRSLTLTTGSPYAGGRLAVAQAKGWLPRRMRVLELASASNPGQSSLWVVDAGAPIPADTEAAF